MKAPFTLHLRLLDNHTGEQLNMAVDLTNEVRISTHAVGDMKMDAELGLGSIEDTVRLIRQRTFRKDLFIALCRRMGALLAERMEDAEGWHDESRVEPARKELGGKWC